MPASYRAKIFHRQNVEFSSSKKRKLVTSHYNEYPELLNFHRHIIPIWVISMEHQVLNVLFVKIFFHRWHVYTHAIALIFELRSINSCPGRLLKYIANSWPTVKHANLISTSGCFIFINAWSYKQSLIISIVFVSWKNHVSQHCAVRNYLHPREADKNRTDQ